MSWKIIILTCSPVILPRNLFLSVSLPFPFFVSHPVSVYKSWLVGELEEPCTPFFLNNPEQSQSALLKRRSRVRLIADREQGRLTCWCTVPVTSRLGLQPKSATIVINYLFFCHFTPLQTHLDQQFFF